MMRGANIIEGAETKQSRVWMVLLITAAAALGLIALFLGSGASFADFIALCVRIPLWTYVAIAFAQAAIVILAAVRWRMLLKAVSPQGQTLSLRHATAATTLAAIAGQILPIQLCTPIIRAWFASRFDIPIMRSLGTSALEQTFQLLVLVSAAVLSFLFLVPTVGWVFDAIVPILVLAAMVVFVRFAIQLASKLLASIADQGASLLARTATRLRLGFERAAQLPDRILTSVTALSLLGYAFLAALNVLLLNAITGVDILPLLIAYPLVLFLMSLPVFPGGLGVVEVTWAGVLAREGLPFDQAVEAALALRVTSTLGFFLIAPLLLAGLYPPKRSAP
ncbi:flippase-like domain-containing protein [Aliiroseovarius sp. Z3]|uniref:lysylphosphatidylglycerol synthase transmembrane domain-containing protein n=1 Tax=Aliiroseovarius sp. Z3 TaxID=2811402 RepID=UPI0023B2916B|nr:lysylphosphatidylglycerol synthase transmembrane domain-containing protein [Aliiroseovarius sp. Z3]MDE9449955.1 flippase-like domain-containing protein [Aliiroseovarius sp. Z3]